MANAHDKLRRHRRSRRALSYLADPNATGAKPSATMSTVVVDANSLQVRLEATLHLTRDLGTHPTEVLRFTSLGDLVSDLGALAAGFAHSRHHLLLGTPPDRAVVLALLPFDCTVGSPHSESLAARVGKSPLRSYGLTS